MSVSGTDGSYSWNARPAHSYWIGHYEHLKCVKTVWWLRAEISFASVEKTSWLRPCRPGCMKRLMLNKATTGRRLRPGALLIIYINIVRGANRLWGEMSTGRNAHGAKRLWGEMSFHGAKCPWGEKSINLMSYNIVAVVICGLLVLFTYIWLSNPFSSLALMTGW